MTANSTTDDDGFFGYIPTANDPGAGPLVVTVIICLLLNALLPCFIAFGKHRDQRKQKDAKDDPWAIKPGQDDAKGFMAQGGGEHRPPRSMRSISDVSHSLKITGNRTQLGYARSLHAPSILSYGHTSVVSAGTVTTSVLNPSVVHGLNGRVGRTQRRFRRAVEKRMALQESGRKAESFFRFDQIAVHGYIPTERQKLDNDDQSFLSKMDTDEVSVKSITMDAEHEDFIPKQFLFEEDEVDITCCGVGAWWKLNWVIKYFDRVVALAEWDYEMRMIMKLTIPFVCQAVFTGLLNVLTIAIIGKLMGTQEVSAYGVVSMLVGLTNEFVGGFWSALSTLCSQAAGANQNKLCGQYVQMAMLLYVIFSLPFMLLWWTKTEAVMIWLGFDQGTAEIGQNYAIVCTLSALLQGISETLHGFLDVVGLENYSTVMGISEDVLDFVVVLQAALFFSPDLYHIGLIHLGIGAIFLVLNIAFIAWKGWFDPYLPGLLWSFSLTNFKAVLLMCKTALAISLGYLLIYGEWEILTILASFLGPAEVAAWSIIGSLWGAMENLTEAIGNAAEVRCSYLLGCGKPIHAQVSSYKSMLLATLFSLFATSILFTMGEDLGAWLTKDPVLQDIIVELLPLFGIGNITMTIGTVSWTLLGAQGRYRLATTMAFCGSWLLTIPLSVLASVALNLNLSGQTAAVVVGYMASGTVNAYFLFRSDWERLSQAIIESHEETPLDPEQPKAEQTTPMDGQYPTPGSALGPTACEDDASVTSQEVSSDALVRVNLALMTP